MLLQRSYVLVPGRVTEEILLGAITRKIKQVIGKIQDEFTTGKSCLTELWRRNCSAQVEQAVDIAYLDSPGLLIWFPTASGKGHIMD